MRGNPFWKVHGCSKLETVQLPCYLGMSLHLDLVSEVEADLGLEVHNPFRDRWD